MKSVKRSKIFTISRRSRASKSRISLLASKTSAGSINAICPVADSSCTKPLTLRLCSDKIGITMRPSRTVSDISSPIQPLLRAVRRIRSKVFRKSLCSEINRRRISINSGEALSRTFPRSSMILSICEITAAQPSALLFPSAKTGSEFVTSVLSSG